MQKRDPKNAELVDLSKYQGDVDFAKVKAAGISGVALKATEGHTYEDPRFGEYVKGASAAGLSIAVYHFLRAECNAEALQEAAWFESVIKKHGGWGIIDIWPVVDVETKNHLIREDLCKVVRTWVDAVKEASGLQPRLYTYPNFADTMLSPVLADIPLWFADYSHDQPPDHSGWTHWDMLQYSDHGSVPGISGPVDLDEYCRPVLPGQVVFPVFDDVATLDVIDADGKIHTGQAYIGKGVSYVPVRFVSDNLGCEVSWDGKSKTITVQKV